MTDLWKQIIQGSSCLGCNGKSVYGLLEGLRLFALRDINCDAHVIEIDAAALHALSKILSMKGIQ